MRAFLLRRHADVDARIWALALAALALASLAPPLMGQGRHSIELFASRDDALPGAPYLGGLGYGAYAGPLGLRLSGAINLTQENGTPESGPITRVGAWTADADVVLHPLRASRGFASHLGGIAPYAMLGAGVHGARYSDGTRAYSPTWSYGFGVSLPVGAGISLEGLARRRYPIEQEGEPVPVGFTRDWEYRAGLAISFGGSRRRNARPVRRPPREDPHHGDTRRSSGTRRSPVLSVPGRMPGRRVSGTSVVQTADRYTGIRYTYGGASPTRGFDCSGFVQYVFSRHDVTLPRISRQMAAAGEPIEPDLSALRIGDLLLFAQTGDRIDHVAIYAGENRIIHATASGGGVRYDDLESARGRWFLRRMVAARRVVGDGAGLLNSLDADTLPVPAGEPDPPDKAPPPR